MKRTCCSWMSVLKLECPSLNLSFPLHYPIRTNEGHVFAPLCGKLTGNHFNTFGLFGWLRLGLCTGAFSGPPKMLLVCPPGGIFFCGWAGGPDSPKIPLVFPPEWRDRNRCVIHRYQDPTANLNLNLDLARCPDLEDWSVWVHFPTALVSQKCLKPSYGIF